MPLLAGPLPAPGITTPDPTATAAGRAKLRAPAGTAGTAAPAPAPAAAPGPAGAAPSAPTSPGGGATTPSAAGAPAGLPPLQTLVGNLVGSLPGLASTLNGLLAPPPPQRSVARSQKQLLDYLLAP